MPNSTLNQKLLEIQLQNQSFFNSEGSEKKTPGTNREAYSYTPGWQIVQSIRQSMDNRQISLIMEVIEEKHEMISYPVFKIFNGDIREIKKSEMYVTIKALFTWKDRETGETEGPWTQIAAGANGTDKSIASAIALAERYFLLKYFHIATRDKADEPDAHDSESLLGIMMGEQPMTATASQIFSSRQQTAMPAAQQQYVQPQMQPQVSYMPQQPHFQQQAGFVQPQQPPQGPPAYNAPYQTVTNDITPYAQRLAHFKSGTENHKKVLLEIIREMNPNVFPKNDPVFINTLINEGENIRHNGTSPSAA